ncbi:MAG TPA: hypothetical protein DCW47_09655 [Lachnospiraceae bacterium]|nr:arsenic efflux protein [Lachnospiraceae bacterium]HAV01438.1 hypothetical protein [Lachnospiraceae bacterium]
MDMILDACIDSVKMLPFLFITYLLMEYLEEHASGKMAEAVERSGRLGPVIGGIVGIFPQCGFSTAASNLYAGKVITVGTLIAIFLSTSDEMLPIFLSGHLPPDRIVKILLVKAFIGILWGVLIDAAVRRILKSGKAPMDIHSLCVKEKCHCDDPRQEYKDMHEVRDLKEHAHRHHHGIIKPALKHTFNIFLFILAVSIIINLVVEAAGEETIRSFLSNKGIFVNFAASLIGLIPNCAASVIITELYMEGMIGFGALMSGLLTGAGIGLLVLFRVNQDRRANLMITAALFFCGVFTGILIDMLKVSL